jgi:hypothetical protein
VAGPCSEQAAEHVHTDGTQGMKYCQKLSDFIRPISLTIFVLALLGGVRVGEFSSSADLLAPHALATFSWLENGAGIALLF